MAIGHGRAGSRLVLTAGKPQAGTQLAVKIQLLAAHPSHGEPVRWRGSCGEKLFRRIRLRSQSNDDDHERSRKMSNENREEAKGRAKKAAGELTGDEKLKQEGRADKASAKVKKGIDKAKDAIKGKDKHG
jgi:uncharacterized protein YjbJ (UPF0337 family)